MSCFDGRGLRPELQRKTQEIERSSGNREDISLRLPLWCKVEKTWELKGVCIDRIDENSLQTKITFRFGGKCNVDVEHAQQVWECQMYGNECK